MSNPPNASFVVVIPSIGPAGTELVNELRMKYDPLEGKIPPHITLIFPQDLFSAEWLARTVSKEFSEEAAIDCVFDTLSVVHEPEGSYLFLSPSDKRTLATITTWHKKLYAHENLISTLRESTPFKAHITVGRFRDAAEADKAYRDSKDRFAPITLTADNICTIDRRQGQRVITSQHRLRNL